MSLENITKQDVEILTGKTDVIDGIVDSIKLTVEETEKHFHNYEKWFGLAGTPSGETHRADRAGQAAPFVLTTGNNAFGNWVQILGSSDTPVKTGMTKFDLHRMRVTAINDAGVYTIQFACGESSELADLITAETFSEIIVKRDSASAQTIVEEVMMKRCNAGDKIWARASVVGADAKTVSFYIGLHEYLV